MILSASPLAAIYAYKQPSASSLHTKFQGYHQKINQRILELLDSPVILGINSDDDDDFLKWVK